MTVVPIKSLPLGFRFHPTDEELVNHYLKRKINGRIRSEMEVIPEIDVCKCEPWDLPGRALIESDDPEWFFFSPKDRKYPNGHRSNRATEAGYWKATGKDRYIRSKAPSAIIGMKKTLVFHRGRAPKGVRTNWIMHEYRTTEPEFDSGEQGGYVLYRLFRKPEESAPLYNVDEMDRSDLSITPSKSSPSEIQNEVDVFEELQTPVMLQWNQVSPVSDIQENTKFQVAVNKYDNNNSLNLKDGYNNNLEQRELVDPLLEALGQADSNGIPNIPSPLCTYVDNSFLCNGNQESNTGLFQTNFNEPDPMDDLLNSFFSNEVDSPSGHEGVGYSDPEWFYMDASNDYSERTFPENAFLQFQSAHDDYSLDSGSESLHDLFNNMDESNAQFNLSNHENNLEESGSTGIKIRSRQPRSVIPNNMPAQQGFAIRRIRLQVSTDDAERKLKLEDNEEICETEQVENNGEDEDHGDINVAPLSLKESEPNLRLRAKTSVEINLNEECKYSVKEKEEIKRPVTFNYVIFMTVMIMIVVLLLVGMLMWKEEILGFVDF